MGRLAGFTYARVVRHLRALGFVFDRHARGSHEIWRRGIDGRKITVPHHPGDIPEGTVRAIVRELGITTDAFLRAA